MYKIDTDIPYTSKKNAVLSDAPWDQLDIGHSFLVKNIGLSDVRKACNYYGDLHSKAFRACRVPEGIRIWRVKEVGERSSIEMKVYDFVAKYRGITKGVLINKLRNKSPELIDQALENMLEKGILLSKMSFHPRSGNPIIKYEVL